MMFFIEDTESGKSLADKIKKFGNRAVVPCTEGELDAAKYMHVIGDGNSSMPAQLVPVDLSKQYIMLVDDRKVVIGDIINAGFGNISIVRWCRS